MHILSVFSDDRVGGPHHRSLAIARALRNQNIDTSFLVPDDGGDFPAIARDMGFEVRTATFRRLHGPRNLRATTRFLLGFHRGMNRVESIINTTNSDLVHVNVSTNFQAAAAAAMSDASFLWHFNDTMTPTPIRQLAALMAHHYADRVAVAADAVGDYYFPNSRTPTDTLYAPVDVRRFNPSEVSNDWPDGFLGRDSAPEGPVVGTIANLTPVKGVEYLLYASARVRRDYENLIVPIVGKRLDSQDRYYRRLTSLVDKLGLDDQVHFCGYREDIPRVLGAFDTFVLPSVAEACPVVVAEAMAMELPVIGTSVGGLPEQLVNDVHGYIVPPKEPDAIADRIITVLDDPLRAKELGVAARRRVVNRFSVDRIAERTANIYQSILQV